MLGLRLSLFLVLLVISGLHSGATAVDAVATDETKSEPAVSVDIFGAAEIAVPSKWKRVKPRSRILEHEFSVPGEEDPAAVARLTMMAAGGNVEANIARWKGQLTGGAPAEQKTEKVEIDNYAIHFVDFSGTYADRMGGGPFAPGRTIKRPDYAMAGAIIVNSKGRKFFVKMIGPKATVKANNKAFRKMLKDLKSKNTDKN